MTKPETPRYLAHEFAERAGVTVRTLHHYDRLGLLRPAAYTEAGYRLYGETELARLEQIVALARPDRGVYRRQFGDSPQPGESLRRPGQLAGLASSRAALGSDGFHREGDDDRKGVGWEAGLSRGGVLEQPLRRRFIPRTRRGKRFEPNRRHPVDRSHSRLS